jgi:rare lipoprotein A
VYTGWKFCFLHQLIDCKIFLSLSDVLFMRTMLVSRLVALTVAIGAISAVSATANAQPQVRGLATWYGPGLIGNRTANGEMFDPSALTAAHRSLPFGTKVRVTNVKNGQSVVVRINDRLGDPSILIDLSMGAAKTIRLTETAPVTMEVLSSN